MNGVRRKLLISMAGVAGCAALVPVVFSLQKPVLQGTQDLGNPNPSGANPDPAMTAAARKAMLEQNQKDIKKNVEKLFDLATELKDQVEKTDSATTLSLALVKKAEEIEKLARQIKDKARG